MGQDDDRDCVEHLWRLEDLTFAADGSHTTYRCERCDGLLPVPPFGEHPETV